MKKLRFIASGVVAVSVLLPAFVRADDDITNRFTFAARFGLNISVRFKGLGTLPAGLVNPRITQDSDRFNYDDGYVLVDSSGNADGLTWYWGYDDKGQQFDRLNNTILMHKSVPAPDISSPSFDGNPNYGGELVFSRKLGSEGKLSYGIEVAANYLNLRLKDDRTYTGNLIRTTYVNAPGEPGTEPPPVSQTTGSWAGRKDPTGSSFLIDANFVAQSPTQIIPGGVTVSGHRQFDADLWGLRLGPYYEIPFGERLFVSMSGGLAVGLLSGSASWTQTIALPGGVPVSASGSGRNCNVLWGFYAGANVSWQFSERWSAMGGAQFQSLGNYDHSFGGQKVEVDFSKSVFVTLGLSYNF